MKIKRVLRRIFEPNVGGAGRGSRRLHNENFHNLCSSPNVIRVIKSRTMRWAGHVARMGTMKSAYGILIGKPEGKSPFGRPRLDGKMIIL
jgi:hypothetical protein